MTLVTSKGLEEPSELSLDASSHTARPCLSSSTLTSTAPHTVQLKPKPIAYCQSAQVYSTNSDLQQRSSGKYCV